MDMTIFITAFFDNNNKIQIRNYTKLDRFARINRLLNYKKLRKLFL